MANNVEIVVLSSDDESNDDPAPPQGPAVDSGDDHNLDPLQEDPASDSDGDDDNPEPPQQEDPMSDSDGDSDDDKSDGDSDDNLEPEPPQQEDPMSDDSGVEPEPPQQEDPTSDDNKKPRGPIYTMWLFCDEKLMLTTLANERRRLGTLPPIRDLYNAVRGQLHRGGATLQDVANKISNLKKKFRDANKKGGPGNNDRDQRVYELSKLVWPEEMVVVID